MPFFDEGLLTLVYHLVRFFLECEQRERCDEEFHIVVDDIRINLQKEFFHLESQVFIPDDRLSFVFEFLFRFPNLKEDERHFRGLL